MSQSLPKVLLFQHTAARRRLAFSSFSLYLPKTVSTHSRPKAAGPPVQLGNQHDGFQHTAARRRLAP